MTLAWQMFQGLCELTNALEKLREDYPPGSDGWCALTQLVQGLDTFIDWLVESDGLEEEE